MRKKWTESNFKYKIGQYVNNDIKVVAYKPFLGKKGKKGYSYIKGYYLLCLVSNKVFQLREDKLKETSKSPYVSGLIPWKGNWLYKEKHILPYLKNPTEAKNFTATSTKNIECICPNCSKEKTMRINNLVKRGFTCINCSKSTPFTELYMICLLEDNNINYVTQKQFNDLSKLYFDFYLPDYNIVIEVQGGYHYNSDARSLATQETDKVKRKYCKDKGIKLIEIDARKTSLSYILNSINHTELSSILRVREENIRELLCKYRLTESDSNIIKEFNKCRVYNETARSLGIDSYKVRSTIEKYGLEYKLLSKEEKAIKCTTVDKVFNSIQEAKDWCGLTSNGLEKVLSGERKHAGKYKGQYLEWEYVD